MSKIEQEANDFAFQCLFNGHDLQRHIFANRGNLNSPSESTILDLAKRFNVDPIFVTFWMKKAGIGNYLVKEFIPSIEF